MAIPSLSPTIYAATVLLWCFEGKCRRLIAISCKAFKIDLVGLFFKNFWFLISLVTWLCEIWSQKIWWMKTCHLSNQFLKSLIFSSNHLIFLAWNISIFCFLHRLPILINLVSNIRLFRIFSGLILRRHWDANFKIMEDMCQTSSQTMCFEQRSWLLRLNIIVTLYNLFEGSEPN